MPPVTTFHISDPSPSDPLPQRDPDWQDRPLGDANTDTALGMLGARVRNDPYATLGIGLGLGVLVGGGMWRLFARSLLGLGTRLAVSAAVTSLFDRPSTRTPPE